jgi:hypothetical protein
MTHRGILIGTVLLAAALGCQARSDAPAVPAPSATASASPTPARAAAPQAALDAIDKRSPVPLLPMMANHQKQNMRDHLVAVQEIISGLWTKDFAAIEKSAGRIGYSEQMGQMCAHMGAGAPGFTEQALNFHRTADKIGDAAKKRDADAVMKALTDTLATCTSCHATFRQQVVDEATWTSATKTAVPAQTMQH